MIDPTKPASDALVIQDLQRRLDALERSQRTVVLSLPAVSDSTYRALSLTDTYATFAGAVSLNVNVPPSGRLAVWTSIAPTLEGGSYVGVYVAPRFTGANTIAPSDAQAVRFFVGGLWRIAWFYVVSGLAPGWTTLSMEAKHTGIAPTLAGLQAQTLMAAPVGFDRAPT